MMSVELSGVTTMPLENSMSPATSRAAPSGVTSAMIPDFGSALAMKSKQMLLT